MAFRIVTVQEGTETISNGTNDISLSPSVDLDSSFVCISTYATSGASAVDEQWFRASLISSGATLRIQAHSTANNTTNLVSWTVYEFDPDDVSVQSGSHALDGTTPDNVTLSTIVLDESFLVTSASCDAGDGAGDRWWSEELTSTTNLQFAYDNSRYNPSSTIDWFVVSAPDIYVQRGTLTGTQDDVPKNATISTAVTMAQTVIRYSIRHTSGSGGSRNRWGDVAFGKLTSTTNIAFTTINTGPYTAPYEVKWEAIEFPSGVDVYRGSIEVLAASTSDSASIGATIDQDLGGVFYGTGWMHCMALNSSVHPSLEPRRRRWTREITNSGADMTVKRALTGEDHDEVHWQVVQFEAGTAAATPKTLTLLGAG